MRAFEYIAGQRWFITEEYLRIIAEITSQERSIEDIAKGMELARQKSDEREHSPAAVAARVGSPIAGTRRATMREGGVAILPVTGPIFRYANLFTAYSGATSTQLLATDFRTLVDNQDVNGILLSFDSPGGEAFGIGELAEMIAMATQVKRIESYISGQCCSAGYYLASATNRVRIDPSGMAGSIGTVLVVKDTRRAEKQRGIDSFEIVSSQSPRKRLEPTSEEGRAALQETADAMAEVFIEAVARNRGVTVEEVLSGFGQGGIFVGKHAVEAGLADELGSFESVLSELAAGKKLTRKKSASAGETTKPATGANNGGKAMSEKTEKRSWLARLLSGASDEEKQEAVALLNGDDAPGASASTTETPQKPAASAAAKQPEASESGELTQLRAKVEKMEKDQVTQLTSTLTAQAEAFINPKILAEEVKPAIKDRFVAAYVQAGLDDHSMPLTDGKKRTDALKAQYEGREADNLTGKTKTAPATGAKVIADVDEGKEKPVTEERKQELMVLTPLGRAAMQAKAKNN